MYGRSPAIGMSYIAYQKFWRLAGVDHMHVNGLANKFCEDDASVIASARECLTPDVRCAGARLRNHAGVFVRPNCATGAGDVAGARIHRSDIRLRGRNHGASGRHRGGSAEPFIRPGKPHWPAFRCEQHAQANRELREALQTFSA